MNFYCFFFISPSKDDTQLGLIASTARVLSLSCLVIMRKASTISSICAGVIVKFIFDILKNPLKNPLKKSMSEKIKQLSKILENLWLLHGQDDMEKAMNLLKTTHMKQTTISETIQDTKTTLPFSLDFEHKMYNIVKSFYSNDIVDKTTFYSGGICYIVDIHVENKIIFDVKSGKVTKREVEKLLKYADLAKVKQKALILSNNCILSPNIKSFCRETKTHILYADTIIEGLKDIESSFDIVEQKYPPNHIKHNTLNIVNVINLSHYYSLDIPVEFEESPQKTKLWKHREAIITEWVKSMESKSAITKTKTNLVDKYGTSTTTIGDFITFVLGDMRIRGVIK
jgi:hypothetical protein